MYGGGSGGVGGKGGVGGGADVGGDVGGGGKHNGDLTSVESPCSGTVTCGKCLLLVVYWVSVIFCNSSSLLISPGQCMCFLFVFINTRLTSPPRLCSQVIALESSWFVGANVSGSAVTCR